MARKTMMIVDDNDALREALRSVFEEEYELRFAHNGEEALAQSRTESPQVVLMDYKMPGMDGIETLQRMQASGHRPPVVMMSAYAEIPNVVSAVRSGAADFVGKPFDVEQLKATVDRAAGVSKPERLREVRRHSRRRREAGNPAPLITQSEVDNLIHQTLRVACA